MWLRASTVQSLWKLVSVWVGRGDRGVRPHNSHTWLTNQQSLWGQKAGRLHLDTNIHTTQDEQTDRVRHLSSLFQTGSLDFTWTRVRRGPPDFPFWVSGSCNFKPRCQFGFVLLGVLSVSGHSVRREVLESEQDAELAVQHGKSSHHLGPGTLHALKYWFSKI